MARRQTPPHLWRLGFLVVLLGFLAVVLTPTLRGYLDQRAQINDVERQIAAEQERISELQGDLRQWEDDEFVERQARERLRFVRPGETTITILDDRPQQVTEPVPGMATVTDEVHRTRPWYGEVWESVKSANTEEPPQNDEQPG